jgi:thiol-disulfide isomerase/thioredoxin
MQRVREIASVAAARLRWWACASVALSAAWLALTAAASGMPEGGATPRSAAPIDPVTASDVLAEVRAERGSVVLVNVWATWCVPCREEFPDLLRLQRELAGRGLRLLLVSADLASQRPQVEEFLRGAGVGFRTFLKAQPDEKFIDGLDASWSGALPATILFDRSGRKAGFWEGGSTYSEILARVKPLLAGP